MSELKAVVETLPAPIARTAITPMELLQQAVDRQLDPVLLEKLMALQERWEANEARKAFVVAKAAFIAERPVVLKNKHVGFTSQRTNTTTDYDHATLDNVCDVLGPALSKQGLSASWELAQTEGKVRVTCVLTHVLGHSERVWLEGLADNSGNKNAVQAISSTVTMLERYTLLAITGVATKNQDDDGRSAGNGDHGEAFISAEQKAALVTLMKGINRDPQKLTKDFLLLMKVPTLDALPAARFDDAVTALENVKAFDAQKAARK